MKMSEGSAQSGMRKSVRTFAPKIPLYPLESITFHDFGLNQPKIIVI